MKRMTVVLMLLLLYVGGLYSQTVMVVDVIDGVGQNIELTTESRLSSQSDSVVILPRSGNNNVLVFAIRDIRRMTFDEAIISVMDSVERPRIHVYPNPVADNLTIEGGGTSNLPLTVYSLDGRVVIHERLFQGNPIDVRALAPGSYLIQIGGYRCKFVKK